MILQPLVKKYKDVQYRKWDPSFTETLDTAPGVPESEIETVSLYQNVHVQIFRKNQIYMIIPSAKNTKREFY